MNKPQTENYNGTDDLLPEYRFDYKKARPNRFATEEKTNLKSIILDPDIAEVFTTSEAVNHALRSLINAMQKTSLIVSKGE